MIFAILLTATAFNHGNDVILLGSVSFRFNSSIEVSKRPSSQHLSMYTRHNERRTERQLFSPGSRFKGTARAAKVHGTMVMHVIAAQVVSMNLKE